MLKLILLGVAGGIGTLARFWLADLAHRVTRGTFPIGSLVVNLLGCLLIGLVMYLVREHQTLHPEARTVVCVGLLGGFTTFSAFGFETFELVRRGAFVLAGANVAGNVVLGIAAVWLGTLAGRALFHG